MLRVCVAASVHRWCAGAAPGFAALASLRDFCWARAIVCSRNFALEINGARTAAMVPFADMLNHRAPKETTWRFEQARQCVTITATRGIRAGSQVRGRSTRECRRGIRLGKCNH